jgi:hypothetical protein
MFRMLKYTQADGLVEIDAPVDWTGEQTFSTWLESMGFGDESQCEEADGGFLYHKGFRHWYHDDGHRLTAIDGACRCETILTNNAADHLALRVFLAPLAHVALAEVLADARATNGTLRKDALEWSRVK